ncbi:MAG: hypothetical protein JW944_02095 [Deltaproteobacteria bacterium]|nr:hypothetical protein [Deltaproteobacteria bacterium]
MKERRIKTLIALCSAIMIIMIFTACGGKDTSQSLTINGSAVEEPVREHFDMAEMMAAMFGAGGMPGGAPGAAGGAPAVVDGAPGESAPGNAAAGGPGGMAGGTGGMAGGPPGMGSDENSIPAVYVDNGKYSASKSKKDVVTAGEIKDNYASGLKVDAEGGGIGGVYVKGTGSEFTLSNSDITVSGDSTGVEGGMNTGATSTDYGTLILRNVNITTDGKSRCATSATKYSTLKVYNSTLTSYGGSEDATAETAQSSGRRVNNYSRTHCSMSNSYAYFYYSTIIANGWGALSTDGAEGFVYLEANNCKIQNTKTGYGTYADGSCHDVFNNCEFDVAATGAVIAGEADATFRNTNVKSGENFVMIHCVMGSYKEVSTLNVTGGEIICKDVGVLVKSQNAILNFNGVKMTSESGLLVKSVVNDDTNATKTEGKKVYGIHTIFRDMEVSGDIVDEDTDRDMYVYLESTTTLKGAIKDAYIKIDSSSRWIATADSNVTITGDFSINQIDAPAGVTINALAGQSGTFKLAGGGTLILKNS